MTGFKSVHTDGRSWSLNSKKNLSDHEQLSQFYVTNLLKCSV